MYIPVTLFQKYTNVYNDDTELQQSYIEAAENIVENYVGYRLTLTTYTQKITNTASEIQLKAKPIVSIKRLTINGINMEHYAFTVKDEFIYPDSILPHGEMTIVYKAGYETNNNDCTVYDGTTALLAEEVSIDGNGNDILIDGGDAYLRVKPLPNIIRSCILRIAALLQTESDSNIGVTGKSFAESGSRTFINFTDFSKYLYPLSGYRLIRI